MNTNAAESLDPQVAALDALLADLDLMGDVGSVPDEVLIENDENLEAAVNAAEAQELVDQHYMNATTEGAEELSLESLDPQVAALDALLAESKGLDPASLFVETPIAEEEKTKEPSAKRGKKAEGKKAESPAKRGKKAESPAKRGEKDEGEKDEGEKDEGEKDEGEKDEGKKDEGKKAESPDGEPKKKVERKHYTSRLERMKDQHGEKLGEFFVLELADAELEGEALAAKQKEFEAVLAGLNKKRQARANLLIDYVAGRTAALNNVIATCFRVLAADGKIVTGDKGNLHQTLLAHPYSPAAARAMGNNSVAVLEAFKVVKKGEAGFVPNPGSLMLLKVSTMLGIAV